MTQIRNALDVICVSSSHIVLEPYMMRMPPKSFTVLRLNNRSAGSWAVIEQPSGAIAASYDGALLMRLDEPKARRLAAELTLQLQSPPHSALAGGQIIQLAH